MKAMVPLRVLALCSNVAFLTYGLGLGLTPVYMLHGILLPMNAWRLQQAIVHRRCARGSNRSYG
jgi:CRP/FNR family cyclic AMP-dependent transcriptional regulator